MHKSLVRLAASSIGIFTSIAWGALDNNIAYDDSWISYFPIVEVIPQGAIGIFKRGGFLEGVYDPGVYFHAPIVTTLLAVNTRPQVDVLTNIECGTKDGLKITFPKISIYNMLGKESVWNIVSRFGEVYDQYLVVQPAVQAINELCAEMTAQDLYIDQYTTLNERLTGKLKEFQVEQSSDLQITQVTVEKPVLPEDIQENYKRIVSEKTRIIAAQEKHKREIKEEESKQARKKIEEENKKILSLLDYDKRITEQEKEAELSRIEVDKESYRKRTQADARAYAHNKTAQAESDALRLKGLAEAEAILARGKAEVEVQEALARVNKELLSENYVRIKNAEAFQESKHMKVIIMGDKIPQSIIPLVDSKVVSSMLNASSNDQN